jgi:hypothetical protein
MIHGFHENTFLVPPIIKMSIFERFAWQNIMEAKMDVKPKIN